MRNIRSDMSLYEQQSTYNCNMPIRGLLYFGKLYDKWLTNHNCNLYGRKLVKLPAPQYYVFYIGTEQHEDREILRLSDAFDKKVEGFEWTASMLNINVGHNEGLLNKCQTLKDYSEFIDSIRRSMEIEKDLGRAVDKSVQEFKKRKGTLARILRESEAEVKEMCITEYNEEATLNAIREEEREEGREEGTNYYATLTLKLLENNRLEDLKRAAMDKEYLQKLYQEYGIIEGK